MTESTHVSYSKKSKGRLKKLLKRAYTIDNSKETSGLIEQRDYDELQQLIGEEGRQNRFIHGPLIGWRRNAVPDAVEAADIRDILFRSTQGTSPCKKRNYDVTSTGASVEDDHDDFARLYLRIPSWASIHNPVLMKQTAVLEFHCSLAQYKSLSALLNGMVHDIYEESKGIASSASVPIWSIGVNTRWFAGLHHPKPMSHALLYSKIRPQKTKEVLSNLTTINDLYKTLISLAPSQDEMKAEGYPMPARAALPLSDTSIVNVHNTEDDQSNWVTLLNQINPPVGENNSNDYLLNVIDAYTAESIVRRGSISIDTEISGGRKYIQSKRTSSSHELIVSTNPRILAIDCEMVETVLGMELARVTLLELIEFQPQSTETLIVRMLMDQLVKPKGRVTDYLTQFSGITSSLLDTGPTVELVQVQATILTFVSAHDILIGHSLENDLHSLHWIHPTVLDTSLLFRAPDAKFKYSLKHLSQNLLRKSIQQGSHCSSEDAMTALELAIARTVKGTNFCRHLLRSKPVNHLEMISRHAIVGCVGPSQWLQANVESSSSIHSLSCPNVTHPSTKALDTWLNTKNSNRRARLVYGSWIITREQEESDAMILIRRLRSKVDATTILCLALQCDYHRTAELAELRKTRLNPKAKIPWMEADQREWTNAIHLCRAGKVYWMSGTKVQEPDESS